MDRELLEALRRRAAEEGREEYEILEEAARFYLEHGDRASITELIERARERRERASLSPPRMRRCGSRLPSNTPTAAKRGDLVGDPQSRRRAEHHQPWRFRL
jgi:hypothetical protein